MTPITRELILELKPEYISSEYSRDKFFFQVFDIDPSEREETHIWVTQGNGLDPQYWNIGFWRTHGGMNMPAHNVTLRHGVRYMETLEEFIKWYRNHRS